MRFQRLRGDAGIESEAGMEFVKGFRPARKDGLVTRNIAGETVIVPVSSNVAQIDSIYTLNEVGSLIWRMLDGETTTDRIVEALCRSYEVTPEEGAEDLAAFLGDLEVAGLVRPMARGAG